MIVRLMATQIPVFWETIKFCAVAANEIDKEDLPEYLNGLLQSLLSEKVQCFVRLSDERILIALMLTKVTIDKLTKKSNLDIQCLYSYQKVSDTDWTTEYKNVKKFAKSLKCDSITFATRNEQVMRLGELVGFTEQKRFYEFNLGGSHGQ